MTCEQAQAQFTAFLSGEMAGDDANDVTAHIRQCPACAADLESMRQAAAALKGLGVRAMPEPVVSRVRRELARHRKPTSRPFLSGLRVWAVVGTVPVLAALVVGLSLFRQQPSTAAEIIARAESAMTKLSSWHFRYRDTRINGKRVEVSYADEWYRAPDMRRQQEEFSGTHSKPPQVKLIRGNEELLYVPKQRIANFRALTEKDQKNEARSYERRSLQPPYAATQHHMMREVRLVGTERVLGRLCDVITGRIGAAFRVRIAVDRETGIPLRTTWSWEHARGTSEMVVFEPNKKIGDDVFQIKLPSDVTVIRGPVFGPHDFHLVDLNHLKNPSETESHMSLALSALTGSALISVCEPTYIPHGYMLQGVFPDFTYVKPDRRGFSYSLSLDIYYINPKTSGTLLLIQSVERLFDGAEAVTVHGVEGRISSFTSPYPYSILTWIEGGVHFSLIGSEISRPELLKVADGMKPLRSLIPGLSTGPTWRITAEAVNSRKDEYVAVTPDAVKNRFRSLRVHGATVTRAGHDHIVITAHAKDPDLIVRSVLSPGFVSFVPVTKAFIAGRYVPGAGALITQDQVQFRDRQGLRLGKPLFLDVRLRYSFYAARLGKHEGSRANDVLAIIIDDRRFVGRVTKGELIRGTRIGPIPADVAAILETGPLPARLKVISKERL